MREFRKSLESIPREIVIDRAVEVLDRFSRSVDEARLISIELFEDFFMSSRLVVEESCQGL